MRVAAFLLIAGAACGPSGTSGPDTSPDQSAATLVINTPTTAMQVSQTLQLQAVARTNDDRVIGNPTLAWESSTAAVATVSNAGLVSALSPGNVRITARSGTATANVELRVVEQPAVTLEMTAPDGPMVVATEFPAVVSALSGTNRVVPTGPVQWSSSNPAAFTVSAAGVVRAVSLGSALITVGNGGLSRSREFVSRPGALQITQLPTSIGHMDSVQLDVFARDANGNRIQQKPQVTWSSSQPATVRVNPDGWAVGVAAPVGFGHQQAVITASAFDLLASTLVTVGNVPVDQPAGLRIVHAVSGLGSVTFRTNTGQNATLNFLDIFEPPVTSGALQVSVEGFPPSNDGWGQSYTGFLVPQTHATLYAVGGPSSAFLLPLWSDAPSVPPGQALFRVLMASDYAATYVGNNMYFLPPGAPVNDFPDACYFDVGAQTAYLPRAATPFDIVLVSPPGFVLAPGNPGVEYARFRVTPTVDRATTYVITGTGPGNMQIRAFLDP